MKNKSILFAVAMFALLTISMIAHADNKTVTIEWQENGSGHIYTEVVSCNGNCEKSAEIRVKEIEKNGGVVIEVREN